MIGILLFLSFLAIALGLFFTEIYGLYLCFKKSWVFGLIGLLVPGFGLVVALFKYFNKDVLA